ncbi:MAG: DUF1343 domain-containing protein, partial [Elusimicrobiota bacterium]|nr:DUF1343 domain-containing protein [Elusimicrobiota bacterium]
GIYIEVAARDKVKPVRLGLELLDSVIKLYPDKFTIDEEFDWLAGCSYIREMLQNREPLDKIESVWQSDLNKFLHLRRKYLMYTK